MSFDFFITNISASAFFSAPSFNKRDTFFFFLHSFVILQGTGGKPACKFLSCDLKSSPSSGTQNAGIMNQSEEILNRGVINQATADLAF